MRRQADPAVLERRSTRPPVGTKPVVQTPPRPPKAASAERKTRIARILARANGTTVEFELAKLDEIAHFERTLAAQRARETVARYGGTL